MTSIASFAASTDRPVLLSWVRRGDRFDVDVWAYLGDFWQLQDAEDTEDGASVYSSGQLAMLHENSERRLTPAVPTGPITGMDALYSQAPSTVIRLDAGTAMFRFDGRQYFTMDPTDTRDGRFPAEVDPGLLWEVVYSPEIISWSPDFR